ADKLLVTEPDLAQFGGGQEGRLAKVARQDVLVFEARLPATGLKHCGNRLFGLHLGDQSLHLALREHLAEGLWRRRRSLVAPGFGFRNQPLRVGRRGREGLCRAGVGPREPIARVAWRSFRKWGARRLDRLTGGVF